MHRRAVAPDEGTRPHRWDRARLASWRRALVADVVVAVLVLVALGLSHETLSQGPEPVTFAAVGAALGVGAALAVRQVGGGAVAGGACFGTGMLVLVIWRLLASSFHGGNALLAVSLGPKLVARLGVAVAIGCLWGYWRSVRRDRRP